MKIVKLLVWLAVGFVIGGCVRDGRDGEKKDRKGDLDIVFSADASVEGVEVTRASEVWEDLETLIPSDGDFTLTIKDSDDATVDTRSIAAFPGDGMEFIPGDYTATAVSADLGEGFDCPRFGVSGVPFRISAGNTTEIGLTARLLNMAVTIDYTEDFKNYFPEGRNVVIMRGEEAIIDFSEQPEGSLAAFIEPGAFSLVIHAKRQNGNEYNEELEISSEIAEKFVACTHQRITIGVEEEVGDISFTFTFNFDDYVETITVPIEVGDEEESNP